MHIVWSDDATEDYHENINYLLRELLYEHSTNFEE